jgi:hypothetical protein
VTDGAPSAGRRPAIRRKEGAVGLIGLLVVLILLVILLRAIA